VLLEGNRIVNNRAGVYSDSLTAAARRRPSPIATTSSPTTRSGWRCCPTRSANRFQDNILLDNGEQVNVYGGGDLTHNAWAVDGRGNYWSDYAGYDADGDAIGDLPYASKSLFENLTGAQPELRLFHLSPASDALDLAAKAFPIFAPQPRMSRPGAR
jgi:nitrous oxidase accessory protein